MKSRNIIICLISFGILAIVLLICLFAAQVQVTQNTALYINGSDMILFFNKNQYQYVSKNSSNTAYYIDVENKNDYEKCYLVYKEHSDGSYLFYCNAPYYVPTSEGNYYVNFKFGEMNLFTYLYYF